MKRRAFLQADDIDAVMVKITTEGCLSYRSIVAIAVGDLLRFKTLTLCNRIYVKRARFPTKIAA